MLAASKAFMLWAEAGCVSTNSFHWECLTKCQSKLFTGRCVVFFHSNQDIVSGEKLLY